MQASFTFYTQQKGSTNEMKCYNCNKFGHISRHCPTPPLCKNCRKSGHIARACPEPIICKKCKQTGHISTECSNEPIRRSLACHNCKQEGHFANECPKPKQERENDGKIKCFKCGGFGHKSYSCNKNTD